MKQIPFLNDVIAIVSLFLLTLVFFSPLFSGKALIQPDIIQHKGMSSEIQHYQEQNNEDIHWTNSMFGGMPTYLMNDGMFKKGNITHFVNHSIRKILPGAAGILFIAFLCFYSMARAFNISEWLSVIGAFLFGASTFAIVSLIAGHNSKINAYAWTPLIIAGIALIFRQKKHWLGAFCIAFGLGAQLAANHLQITFYAFLICLCFVIYELITQIKTSSFRIAPYLFSILGVILALGLSYNKLATVYNHSKLTIRGGQSVLNKEAKKSSGLSYDRATDWSYSPSETFTLLIPNFKGGSGAEQLGSWSKWKENQRIPASLREKVPTYWGKLPFTAGPVYVGAVCIGLFFLAFFIRQKDIWWILAASILLILLSWGKYSPIYRLFYDGFPFFNKFRTPMMSLLMLSLLWPLLAILGLNKVLKQKTIPQKTLLIALGIPFSITLLIGVIGSYTYRYGAGIDNQLLSAGFPKALINTLKADRATMLRIDSIRSIVLLLITGVGLFLWLKNKIKPILLVGLVAILAFFDLYSINKRYLTAESFESKEAYTKRFQPTEIDKKLLKDKGHFRVFSMLRDPFSEATTSLHHKSIGGYHAAKLQPFQDVIDTYSGENFGNLLNVMNQLNVQYFIGKDERGVGIQQNDEAYGNAWFVNNVSIIDHKKDALKKLHQLEPSNALLVAQSELPSFKQLDASQAEIKLESYHPEKLVYKAVNRSNANQFAVFSEIFYQQEDGDGWFAKLDGKEVNVYQPNFLLRGLEVPKGEHTIEFYYNKTAFNKRAKFSLFFSILILGLLVTSAFFELKKSRPIPS